MPDVMGADDPGPAPAEVPAREWDDFAATMNRLDDRVAKARLSGIDGWTPPYQTNENAGIYMQRASDRLDQIFEAVKKAASSPEEKMRDLGREVGSTLVEAASKGRKIAKKMGHAAEAALARIEKDMESVPWDIGAGFGIVVIAALLILLGRHSG